MACIDCRSKEDCLYYYMYEKSVAKRGYAPPQRPIIIIPPFLGKTLNLKKDGYLNIEILLFGEYVKFIPHVLLALRLSGQDGLGADRHYGLNRFEISSAHCGLLGKHIFDGSKLDLANLEVIDIQNIPVPEIREYKLGFRTPLSQVTFPPLPQELINLIRNRLIRIVNEYGDGTKIQDANITGQIIDYQSHFHNLQRRSTRSNKKIFKGHTGIVEYEIKEIDDVGKWLLVVGELIGAGPDSSFGCGFFKFKVI